MKPNTFYLSVLFAVLMVSQSVSAQSYQPTAQDQAVLDSYTPPENATIVRCQEGKCYELKSGTAIDFEAPKDGIYVSMKIEDIPEQ